MQAKTNLNLNLQTVIGYQSLISTGLRIETLSFRGRREGHILAELQRGQTAGHNNHLINDFTPM